ncbi:MAG: DinB family protein [Gemmatimonadota bacterium]|nr:DinB family protein [Gemmatimonadota bacterium]
MGTQTRPGLGAILAGQIGVTAYVLGKNLEGITHEDSLRHPSAGGNSLNWIVGHMADARNKLAIALTEEPVFSPVRLAMYDGTEEATYSADEALDFDELQACCQDAGEAVISALTNMDDEALSRPAPFSVTGNPDETVGSLASTFAFHDAYHAGQTGVLRRVCGHPGVLTPPDVDA